jgi:hypothetical protein
MISKPCDRCERLIEIEDNRAGTKVACPHCGDTNVMPGVKSDSAALDPAPAPDHRTRPQDQGHPPDHGPEQRVRLVRPAWVRSRPLSVAVMALLAAAGAVLGAIRLMNPASVPAWLAVVAALALLAGVAVLGWWWFLSLSAALEITNKRTVARRGLLSRSTSEVVHDNIRNVQVDQTFWERLWSVGTIGISSSGQDGIEIQMRNVPHPQELQKLIDLYRPLD